LGVGSERIPILPIRRISNMQSRLSADLLVLCAGSRWGLLQPTPDEDRGEDLERQEELDHLDQPMEWGKPRVKGFE